MQEPATFKRLRNADIAVIHEDVEEMYWWLLRSLPAIAYLGFTTFTYPTSWRTLNTGGQFQSYTHQYDYLDYEYKVLGQIEEESFEDDLVAITNQYYEGQSQYPIDHLVSRYSAREETLVVVTDSKRFTPRGGQRPLYQEQSVEHIGSYDRLFSAYETIYEDARWSFPLLDTKNLFLQDNANLYELVDGTALETTEELFMELPDAPFLPLYRVFEDIFGREDQYGTVPLNEDDIVGLERWLRRRVEWDRGTADDIARMLNRRVSEEGRTFDQSFTYRSAQVHEARRVAKGIDAEESTIHKRYHAWLQRRNL